MVMDTLIPFILATISIFVWNVYSKHQKQKRLRAQEKVNEKIKKIKEENMGIDLDSLVGKANRLARTRIERLRKSK